MRVSLGGVVAAATVVLASAMNVPVAQAAPVPGWRIVEAGSPTGDMFADIVATGPGDAWAFGSNGPERWNGKTWQVYTGSNAPVGDASDNPIRVSASSPDNIWVSWGSGVGQFLYHWNGKGWTTTTAPVAHYVMGLTTTGPNDAWMFGDTSPDPKHGIFKPLARHFDGKTWRTVAGPGYVSQVSAVSRTNIWALSTNGPTGNRTVAAHWNGRSWTTISLPDLRLPKKIWASPAAIYASSASNVWVTESILRPPNWNPAGAVLLHWNGRSWSHITAGGPTDSLSTVAPDGSGGLWIQTQYGNFLPGIIHYSHGTWKRFPLPTRQGWASGLMGMAQVPGTDSVWGSGWLQHNGQLPLATIFKFGR